MRTTLLLGVLIGVVSCSTTQELGNTKSGIAAFVGEWDGYIENYQLPSGSDRVKIVLALEGTDLTGTVVFGTGDPPAPPTDPDVGYLSAATEDPCVEAFGYSVLGAQLTSERLQFKLSSSEPWKAWCEMQTPIEDTVNAGGNYMCVPNCGTAGSDQGCYLECPDNVELPVDCGKLGLCQFMCKCTADGCSVPMAPGALSFDMAVTGDKADGSIAFLMSSAIHNLRLTRVQ